MQLEGEDHLKLLVFGSAEKAGIEDERNPWEAKGKADRPILEEDVDIVRERALSDGDRVVLWRREERRVEEKKVEVPEGKVLLDRTSRCISLRYSYSCCLVKGSEGSSRAVGSRKELTRSP